MFEIPRDFICKFHDPPILIRYRHIIDDSWEQLLWGLDGWKWRDSVGESCANTARTDADEVFILLDDH